jgi:uncharacterized protein YbjQ (UPF0145 family)
MANQDEAFKSSRVKFSALNGNEVYCTHLLGYSPSDMIIGNSVFSMGIIGSIRSNVRNFIGGEVVTVTNMISEGRRLSLDRFNKEMNQYGGAGATGVDSELVFHKGNVEFLSMGSAINKNAENDIPTFTTSADAQDLFCHWDAGYQPISFVFGNVAYSIGFGRNIFGSIRKFARGEVKQYSDIFNTTRNLALQRIEADAKSKGANSIVGIKTTISAVSTNQIHEMIMVGTASYNPQLANITPADGEIISNGLSAVETWNLARIGYAPIKLLIGTSVYSLGIIGGVKAVLGNLVKGEINTLTNLIYEAREEALKILEEQAEAAGADDVLSITTHIYDIGSGLIEFMAIGTAVKKMDGLSTHSDQIPPQAIVNSKNMFVDKADNGYGIDLQNPNFKR